MYLTQPHMPTITQVSRPKGGNFKHIFQTFPNFPPNQQCSTLQRIQPMLVTLLKAIATHTHTVKLLVHVEVTEHDEQEGQDR